MKPFFDTNILLYAFLDGDKRQRAQEILSDGGTISAQVLNEFSNVSLRKYGREWKDVANAIATLRQHFPRIVPLTAETHTAAMSLMRSHKFSFYDALILASALLAECDVLYSEDLQDGQGIGTLVVKNPFK